MSYVRDKVVLACDAHRCSEECICSCHLCDYRCNDAILNQASPVDGPLILLFSDVPFCFCKRANGELCLTSIDTLVRMLRGESPSLVIEFDTEADNTSSVEVCLRYEKGSPAFDRLVVGEDWFGVLADGMLFSSINCVDSFNSFASYASFRKLFGNATYKDAFENQRLVTLQYTREMKSKEKDSLICLAARRLQTMTSSSITQKVHRDIENEQRKIFALQSDTNELLSNAQPTDSKFDALAAVKVMYLKGEQIVGARQEHSVHLASMRNTVSVAREFAGEGMYKDAYETLSLAMS